MIFLDNASTTKISANVKNTWQAEAECFYNASASYAKGLENKLKIEKYKKNLCKKLFMEFKDNIIFTGSASEANNLAILGSIKRPDAQYIFSEGEHLSVHNCALELKNRGFNVKFVPLKADGTLNVDILKELLQEKTAFVSCIHVSNETGAENNIEHISNLVKSYDDTTVFHSDGVQAFGKLSVNLSKLKNVDLYTISAHKIGGPKGIGALFARQKSKLKPIIFGGGQEYGLRSGTENLASIAAFSAAADEMFENQAAKNTHIVGLNAYIKGFFKEKPGVSINSADSASPYIISLSFVGVKGETLVRICDDNGVLVGTGSACSSKKSSLNRILASMGKTKAENEGAIRISLWHDNTLEDIKTACNLLYDNFVMLNKKLH